MKQISIFSHVLGPVLRGPSSSHTAGAFHIASMVRSMVGGLTKKVLCSFDPGGSYAHTYAQQGAGRAFAMGLLNRPLTDETFFQVLAQPPAEGLDLKFSVNPIPGSDHPNMVQVQATGRDGAALELLARSIGGGEIEITSLHGWPVLLNGEAHVLAVEVEVSLLQEVASWIEELGLLLVPAQVQQDGAKTFLVAQRSQPASQDWIHRLRAMDQVHRVLQASPVYSVQMGTSLFESAAEMVSEAERRGLSLGEIAVQYEAQLLCLEPGAVIQEMLQRYAVMEQAVRQGLEPGFYSHVIHTVGAFEFPIHIRDNQTWQTPVLLLTANRRNRHARVTVDFCSGLPRRRRSGRRNHRRRPSAGWRHHVREDARYGTRP
jgi:L-serine dehydratase